MQPYPRKRLLGITQNIFLFYLVRLADVLSRQSSGQERVLLQENIAREKVK